MLSGLYVHSSIYHYGITAKNISLCSVTVKQVSSSQGVVEYT